MISLSIAGLFLALGMAFYSGYLLYQTEQKGGCAQPYVMPVFVGVAYIIMHSMMVLDALNSGRQTEAVRIVAQLIDTMLIISVLILLYRNSHRRE